MFTGKGRRAERRTEARKGEEKERNGDGGPGGKERREKEFTQDFCVFILATDVIRVKQVSTSPWRKMRCGF